MRRWYVVNALPRQEARAEENLRRQGYRLWLPLLRRTRRHARRVDSVLAPLFPGYLFVSLDLETERWRAINGTFGVVRLIADGNVPVPVPEGIVEAILARSDPEGSVSVALADLVPGQTVRVVEGPFAELDALFEEPAGPARVILLFNLLGRQVRATVPLNGIAA